MEFQHDRYISPLSWRYGSDEMRTIWSEEEKRRLMREVWVALATAQQQAGLVTLEQLYDLKQHMSQIDITRALEIEKDTKHDVMAEIRTFAEQATVGGGIIHLGATSADITDNVDVLRMRKAAVLLEEKLKELLRVVSDKIEQYASLPTMAHTHIQPAEPTTVGYRFAVYGQDLLEDLKELQNLIINLRGKGLKGAVGTQASYAELLEGNQMSPLQMESIAMATLNLDYFPIATQTYTRQQDVRIQNVLAGVASSLHKFGMDFRILQSPPFGEWAEPFGSKQVGSSAMPFKRNPINTENICSLARYVAAMPAIAWDNASQAILERSLDDSANRRLFQAESFLLTDELIRRATRVIEGMNIDERAVAQNMKIYGPFAATERVLMGIVRAGGSRQEGHEWIREASLAAWATLREGDGENPLTRYLINDLRVRDYLDVDAIEELMVAEKHLGTAVIRARMMGEMIRQEIGTPSLEQ